MDAGVYWSVEVEAQGGHAPTGPLEFCIKKRPFHVSWRSFNLFTVPSKKKEFGIGKFQISMHYICSNVFAAS